MPQIVYCGPLDEVDVPALRLRATPGRPVVVTEAEAESLLAQLDNWAEPGSPAAKAAAARVIETEKRLAAEAKAAEQAAKVAAGTTAPVEAPAPTGA